MQQSGCQLMHRRKLADPGPDPVNRPRKVLAGAHWFDRRAQ